MIRQGRYEKTIIVIFSAALLAAAFVTVRYPSILRDLILGGSEPISVFTAGNPTDILLPDNASFRQDHPDWASDKWAKPPIRLAITAARFPVWPMLFPMLPALKSAPRP